jgi:gliding motility-associated-like protein
MQIPLRYMFVVLVAGLCLLHGRAQATHIVGGEVTYKYMGSSVYEITLIIYEDCLNGTPAAIASDNPAYVAMYDGAANMRSYDSVHYTSSVTVPANFSNSCVTDVPPVCLLKKTFIINYNLPPNATGYVFSYQRCCRNSAVVNIESPAFIGATYYCTIPPAIAGINNSAVFTNFPAQIICVNNPLIYNNSATDADGDSLSYELCNSVMADDNNTNTNDPPLPPPYASVKYISPYTYSYPMTGYPPLQIDPKTGIITGTPNRTGRYLVTVCCNEWRDGVIINTIRREFQFVVTPCSKVVVANIPLMTAAYPNTFELDCKDHTIQFLNTSKGGMTWNWYFGVPSAIDTAYQPTFTYPDTGTFSVKLIVNPGSTCADSIIRLVRVYPTFTTAYTDSGNLCQGDPIYFTDRTASTVQPITSWQWYFGDGGRAAVQNPVHSYVSAGSYKTMLISQNATQCIDTNVQQVIIERFVPFAGNDTTIVKGEQIRFNATGGDNYEWSPATNLSEPYLYDPTGIYPDTGRYVYAVHISSAYGCTGYDTIKVTVVAQAEFFVPTAFTPNGDGHNDVFRPIAVGYAGLGYFRVFNRWGEVVYNNTSLDEGWDGTYNHRQCDIGTYYWEIRYTDRFGKKGALKGDVTLLR